MQRAFLLVFLAGCAEQRPPDLVMCSALSGDGTTYAHSVQQDTFLGFSGQDVLDRIGSTDVLLTWTDGAVAAGRLELEAEGRLPVAAWDSPWPEVCPPQLEITAQASLFATDGSFSEYISGVLTAKAEDDARFWGREVPRPYGPYRYHWLDPGFDPERTALTISAWADPNSVRGHVKLSRYDSVAEAHVHTDVATFGPR